MPPMTDSLAGQRAIVTGGSSGIGAGIVQAFAAAGADVILNHLSSGEDARSIAKSASRDGGKVVPVQADVSDPAGCGSLYDAAVETFGGVDILVANAGIQRDSRFTEMSLDEWRQVIDVNLTGQFLCAQGAVSRFREQGFDPDRSCALGKIIFMSSVHQTIPWAGRANYAAAKGGVKLLMESVAQEVAAEKIRVNAIAPGAIKTPINEEAWKDEESASKLLRQIPYGRIGEVDDISRAAVWLASDLSDYVVGTTLFVDGGMTLYPSLRDAN